MPAKKIDGRAVAARIEEETKKAIEKHGLRPGLAVILVGDDPASQIYVRKKQEACQRVGIEFELVKMDEDAGQDTVIAAIQELNGRDDINAILVQLPLPGELDTEEVIRSVDPNKDVDGFHPDRLRQMTDGVECDPPGLIEGLQMLFAETGLNPKGMHAVVAANSPVFALPLEICLTSKGATVEIVSGEAPDLAVSFRRADLIVTALGRPNLITEDMLKPGVVILDVGTTRINGHVVGDVDYKSASKVASWITPVPGGVGPVTVAMLLKHVTKLAKDQS